MNNNNRILNSLILLFILIIISSTVLFWVISFKYYIYENPKMPLFVLLLAVIVLLFFISGIVVITALYLRNVKAVKELEFKKELEEMQQEHIKSMKPDIAETRMKLFSGGLQKLIEQYPVNTKTNTAITKKRFDEKGEGEKKTEEKTETQKTKIPESDDNWKEIIELIKLLKPEDNEQPLSNNL